MAKKFIPPVDVLNSVTPKKNRRSFSDRSNQSILRQAKEMIRDSFSPDAFEQVGAMKAVVLEVIGEMKAAKDDKKSWKYSSTSYLNSIDKAVPFVEIYIRVPELHAHLPEPEDADDKARIRKHPIALLFDADSGTTIPEPGDIVEVSFTDKNNFKDGVITSVISSNSANKSPKASGCSPSNSYNSSVPSLNTSQPSGDKQKSAPSAVTNTPTSESSEDGIQIRQAKGENILNLNYFVTLKEFDTMLEFRNMTVAVKTLLEKNIFNVTIQVANGFEKMIDTSRLVRFSDTLKDTGIGLFLYVTSDVENSISAIDFMARVAKEINCLGIFFNSVDTGWGNETIQETIFKLNTVAESLNVKVGYMVSEAHEDTSERFYYDEGADYIYFIRNHLDANDTDAITFPDLEQAIRLYHLDGYNFLPTQQDPCLTGERTAARLRSEIKSDKKAGFLNYSALDGDKIKAIQDKTVNLQNSLNTQDGTQKTSNAKLEVEAGQANQQKEQPSFNTEATGSQDVKPSSPPSNFSPVGSQCLPTMGGAGTVGGASVPPAPPTFRFDEIDHWQNKLWVASAGTPFNQASVVFMDRLAQLVYQQISINDPIFASTAAKKLRVTSCLRTPETQVRLMWDKTKQWTVARIIKLYGGASWAKQVMAYKPAGTYNKAMLQTSNFQAAAQVVRNRVALGGNGHLYGNGVDIGTKYNLEAEGIKSSANQKITEAKMKTSRFVKAVIAAAAQLGARGIAEDYQEHIHITFKA